MLHEGQSQLGEIFKIMPSMKKLIKANQRDVKMPDTDKNLIELLKLSLPMNRAYKPMKIEAIKQQGSLPPHFKRHEICEDEAKKVWHELSTKFPKLQVIEKIPILDPEAYGWHERLLVKICEYNEWARKVVKAKETVDYSAPKEVSAEILKLRKQAHQQNLKVHQ